MASSVARVEAGRTGASQSLGAALATALFDSALPGEADDVDPAAREAIGAFVAATAATRLPGNVAIALDATALSGGGRRRLALAIINDDMPFLVDSVSSAITAAGLAIDRLMHPIVDVERDAAGTLTAVAGLASGLPGAAMRESVIYIELERASAKARVELLDTLQRVLADVRVAVEDWPAMLAMLRAISSRTRRRWRRTWRRRRRRSSTGWRRIISRCSGRGVMR